MIVRLLVFFAALACLGTGPAAAQFELVPEGARAPAKRTKASPQRKHAAPPTLYPSPAKVPPAVAPATPDHPPVARADPRPQRPAPSPDRKTARPSDDRPMQVHLVRLADPGCEPDCPEWIAAQGRIDGSTLAQFKKVIKKLAGRKVPVLIDSSGGAVDSGLAIGRLVRANGLDVAVTKTELVACPKGDTACRKATQGGVKLGRPVALISKCASACVFVLAGGVQRYASARTLVGVHQFTESRSQVLRTYRIQPQPLFSSGKPKKILVSEKVLSTRTRQISANDKSYRDVRKFFAEMGIGADIMRLLMSSPADSIRILVRDELEATKIATTWKDGEELITGVPFVLPALAAPAEPKP